MLRGTGFGYASAACRIASAFVPVILGAWLWPLFGLTPTFIILGGLIVVSLIWMWLVGPETRGRALDHIEGVDDADVGVEPVAPGAAAPR